MSGTAGTTSFAKMSCSWIRLCDLRPHEVMIGDVMIDDAVNKHLKMFFMRDCANFDMVQDDCHMSHVCISLMLLIKLSITG